MPRFEPFAGLRYDDARAPLQDVVAPPYDVIDATERDALAGRSPYNAVHVELPLGEGQERYAHARTIFDQWIAEGALRYDPDPAFYAYRMRYIDETGTERTTSGVIGALEMDVTGAGTVLPHERTMPKPKGDRLDLLRATQMNTSPIWGLSLAEGLGAVCAKAVGSHALLSATDDEGVIHEVAAVTDPEIIAEIVALVGSAPVVIADGHHRYETATFYRQERRDEAGDVPGPYDLVMAYVVELSPEELFVEPIHRLISGLPDDFDILGALAGSFEIEDGPDDPAALLLAGRDRGALAVITPEGSKLLVPRPSVAARAEADLDSSRLDVALGEFPAHDLLYQHGVHHVAEAVASGRAQAAVLLRPATVAQIAETAHSGVRMPPKTTFFSPKPRTGAVYRHV